MVNAAARRASKSTTATKSPISVVPDVDTDSGETDMPTATATLKAGQFDIKPLGDFEFTRQGAGRKREASIFDDSVDALVGQGPQQVPVADAEEADYVVKQLAKACEYRNRGLEKRVVDTKEGMIVAFTVNEAKAKRAPRKPKSVEESAVSAETE